MSIPWSSLYCPSNDAETIALAFRQSLSALGYELYNPFGIMPGKAYRQSVKVFVAPASNGWVRVVGEPDARQLASLSQSKICLFTTLNIAEAHIQVFANGQQAAAENALAAYLRGGRTVEDVRQILAGS